MPKSKLRASDSDGEPLEKKKKRLLLELEALRREESQCRSPTPLSEFSDHVDLSNESLSDGSFQDTPVPIPTTEVKIPSEFPSEADPEIALLLGDVHSTTDSIFGKPVLQPLADRWEKYLILGVEKSDKEDIEKKYPPPKNIPLLRAPLLNPELESSIPAVKAKADKYLAKMQSHLGTGLTALSEVIDKILTPGSVVSEPKTDILPAIVAASKIFCGVFNMMSTNRKYNVEGHLNPTVKKIVRESRPDKYLCGSSFADKFKEAKNQWRTGREMKKFPSGVVKKSSFPSSRFSAHKIQQMPGTSHQDGSLNFQRKNIKTRMKGKQQHRQQYSRERPMSTENSEKQGIYSNRNFWK